MYSRVIRSRFKQSYLEWIKENNYSIRSPRHRGYYAEMTFRKFCQEKGITSVKINPFIDVLEQIPGYFLRKMQQKELKKLGKIKLDFFCFGKEGGYFMIVKMGTSNLNANQKGIIAGMVKNKVFLFRVFEDADIFIKKLN